MLDTRTIALATHHFRDVATRILRILRTLFHEVMGFMFLAIAAWGGLWLVRNLRQFDGEGEQLFKITLVSVFVLVMGSFGVSSFWRARRISRGK